MPRNRFLMKSCWWTCVTFGLNTAFHVWLEKIKGYQRKTMFNQNSRRGTVIILQLIVITFKFKLQKIKFYTPNTSTSYAWPNWGICTLSGVIVIFCNWIFPMLPLANLDQYHYENFSMNAQWVFYKAEKLEIQTYLYPTKHNSENWKGHMDNG